MDDSSNFIQPLEVGYNWTYIDSTFSNDGIIDKIDTSTLSIIDSEIINSDGKDLSVFYWKWDFSNTIWLYANENGNLYNYGIISNEEKNLFAPSLKLPYPIGMGDLWESIHYNFIETYDSLFVSNIDTLECLYTDYPFNTSIGELNCITVYNKEILDDMETYTYYAPNIGYVGLVKKENDIVIFKKTLINYDFPNT